MKVRNESKSTFSGFHASKLWSIYDYLQRFNVDGENGNSQSTANREMYMITLKSENFIIVFKDTRALLSICVHK